MKKIIAFLLVMVVVICVIFTAPVMAGERKAAAVTQFMIAADHSFWGKEKGHLSGYVYGCYFYNLNAGYSAVYGYAGPKLTYDKFGIYFLTVLFADATAWSPGPSLWAEYTAGKNNFFVEGDYYAPWLSTSSDKTVPLPDHQYYGTTEYARSLKDDVKLGVMMEAFGSFEEKKPGELAFGPTLTFKRLKFWAFYDQTPLIHNGDVVGLRVKLTL